MTNRYSSNKKFWQCGNNHKWNWITIHDWMYGTCEICGAKTCAYLPFEERSDAELDDDWAEEDPEARDLHTTVGMRRQEMDHSDGDRERRL